MANVVGADPDGLEAVAAQVAAAEDRLRLAHKVLNGPLHTAPWFGPYANQFRNRWDHEFSAALKSAADFLESAVTELRKEAEQQRNASSGNSVATVTPPSVAPVPKDPPPDDSAEDAIRSFLEGLGLSLEEINELLKKFKGKLDLLNKLLENDTLGDVIKILGKVTSVLDVINDFFEDFSENSSLPLDQAIVHAIAETALRFAASEGAGAIAGALTSAIMTAIAPGLGTAASAVVSPVVSRVVGELVDMAMDKVDGEFNIYDGFADKVVDLYEYVKTHDVTDMAVDALENVGEGIVNGAEDLYNGAKDLINDAGDAIADAGKDLWNMVVN